MTTQSLISLFVMGQLALVIAILVLKQPMTRIHLLAAGLLVSVVGYLVVSNGMVGGSAGPLYWLFYGLALLPAYLVWLFAIELFEFKRLHAGVRGVILFIPAIVFGLSVLQGDGALTQLAHTVHRFAALALLVHLAIIILHERHDDLLNRRRSFRVWFVSLIALHASAILIVELIYAGSGVPEVLEIVNMIAIAVLVAGLSAPLLKVDEQIVWQSDQADVTPQPHGSAPAREGSEGSEGSEGGEEKADRADRADRENRENRESRESRENRENREANAVAQTALIQALKELMEQGYYTTTGLTIKQLAEELNTSEHALRATINQQLGYRNFSAFLNAYRLPAAQLRLADPKFASTPVLTIALDLG
ncbi:MAG: hypothetical protein RIC89_18630, partial [Pseudomonadales bacterium]